MDAFKNHEIISDVIDELPNEILKVEYRDENINLNLGDVVAPTQVKNEPLLNWNADPNSLYTVILADPDAPSRQTPTFREVAHWMVVNVPGNDISKGEVKYQYIGSGAPQGTGLHRYVFMVYKQNDKQDFSALTFVSNRSRQGRRSFNTKAFVKENGLGPLVAANFFQAEWDEYVPLLHKQLDGNQ